MKNPGQCNLIVDLSNLAWISRYSLVKGNDTLTTELIFSGILNIMKLCGGKYKANGVLVACDSQNNWRKDIYPQYKGNRDKEKDQYYPNVIEAIKLTEEFLNTCTSIPAIYVPRAEADDIIAISSKRSSIDTVIVSSDKDFIQLLDDKTRLYSPTLKNERTTTNKDFDLFEKCIRGDRGDNILSAYPYVKKKKLEFAWNDKLMMANLMEEKRKVDGKKVGDCFEFNKKLIDFNAIPQDIQNMIVSRLDDLSDPSSFGKYSHLKILQFLGKNSLKKIAKEERSYSSIFKKRYIL